MTFETWMTDLNKIFSMHFGGLTSEDFPDYLWHDEYSSGCTPMESFQEWRLQTNDGDL